MPCVVFALDRESRYFRRFWKLGKQVPAAPCRACHATQASRSILYLQPGLGAQAMIAGLHWALQRPLSFVLLAGFSGALIPELKVGDLVQASEFSDTMGHVWPAARLDFPPDIPRGRLLTTAGLVGEPTDKSDLATRHRAVAVDMESAHAARLCHEARIPFACLRAISDDATMRIPREVISLLKDGRASAVRLVVALLRQPRLIGPLWRLGQQTNLAARRLAEGLNQILGYPMR